MQDKSLQTIQNELQELTLKYATSRDDIMDITNGIRSQQELSAKLAQMQYQLRHLPIDILTPFSTLSHLSYEEVSWSDYISSIL
jgi:hypothetical protein